MQPEEQQQTQPISRSCPPKSVGERKERGETIRKFTRKFRMKRKKEVQELYQIFNATFSLTLELRQPPIHELRYKGCLVIQNYGKSETVILEYVLRGQKCKNDKILGCLSVQILASSRIKRTQRKLPHLELCRPSRIVVPFICWIFF